MMYLRRLRSNIEAVMGLSCRGAGYSRELRVYSPRAVNYPLARLRHS